MRRSGHAVRGWLAAALLPLAAAACWSPQPALYMLVPEAGKPVDHALAPVAVRIELAAKYLDRPQIVRHHTAYELGMSDDERWGEPIAEMIAHVLVAELAQRLPGTTIATASSAMMPETARNVVVEIGRFDADPDGTVVLDARWTIVGRGGPRAPQSARIALPAGKKDTSALVAAMSRCLGQLSDRLAAALSEAN